MFKGLDITFFMTFEQLTQGFEGSEKKKQFNLEVEEIEAKNSSFFADRKSKYEPSNPDKLKNHFHFDTVDTGFATLIFTDDELPQYIVDEVLSVFKSIYPK